LLTPNEITENREKKGPSVVVTKKIANAEAGYKATQTIGHTS
jgi:hypothetical protein